MTLLELVERCEKAAGPDRKLDALLACESPLCKAEYVVAASPSRNRPGMVTRHFEGGGHGTFTAAKYTASLDAALTLVPEGAKVTTQTFGGPGPMALVEPNERFASAATLPLAICAAALRARAAQ